MIAALFARNDSRYKDFPELYDVYDIDRDARNFIGDYPVIAHPPCRAWGMLSHMANPRPDEKDLAWFALDKVRTNGGGWNILKVVAYGKRRDCLKWGKAMILMGGLLCCLTSLILVMLLTKILNFIFVVLRLKIYHLCHLRI